MAFYKDPEIPESTALFAAQFHFATVTAGVYAMRRITAQRPLSTLSAMVVFVLTAGVAVPLATTIPTELANWFESGSIQWQVSIRTFLCVAFQRQQKFGEKAEKHAQVLELLATLADKDRAVFALVVQGKFNKQNAVSVGMAQRRVKAHRSQVMNKMQVAAACRCGSNCRCAVSGPFVIVDSLSILKPTPQVLYLHQSGYLSRPLGQWG